MMHQHNTEHLNKRAFSIEKRIAKMNRTARRSSSGMKAKFGQTNFWPTTAYSPSGELKKSFGARTLFDHVSLRVEPGTDRPFRGQRHRQVHPAENPFWGGGGRQRHREARASP